MGKIVNDIIPGAKYFPKLGIPLHEIYSYKLLKKGDREYIEDLIPCIIASFSYYDEETARKDTLEFIESLKKNNILE